MLFVIQSKKLRFALPLVLTVIALCCACSGNCTGTMYVVSSVKGVTSLNRYSIDEKGGTLLKKSIPLKRFLVQKMVFMPGFSSNGCEVCITDTVISPNHLLLACSYFLALPGTKNHEEIRIYDLKSGEITHQISNPNADRSFYWCSWKDNDTLLFSEGYAISPHSEAIDVGEYSLASHTRSHIRTKVLSDEHIPEPEDYYLRSKKPADELNSLGFTPVNSYPFSAQYFGGYNGNSRAAISDDDSFAVVQVFIKEITAKQFVIISGGKVRAKFTLPKNTAVNRLKLVDKFLLIAIVENKQHSVKIYDRDSGKFLSSVPGDIVVD